MISLNCFKKHFVIGFPITVPLAFLREIAVVPFEAFYLRKDSLVSIFTTLGRRFLEKERYRFTLQSFSRCSTTMCLTGVTANDKKLLRRKEKHSRRNKKKDIWSCYGWEKWVSDERLIKNIRVYVISFSAPEVFFKRQKMRITWYCQKKYLKRIRLPMPA